MEKNKNIIIVLLTIVIVVLIGLLVIKTDVFKLSSKNDENVIENKNNNEYVDINTNDKMVQEIYNIFKHDRVCSSNYSFVELIREKQSITKNDISQELRNQFGYYLMTDVEVENLQCSWYAENLGKYGEINNTNYRCGYNVEHLNNILSEWTSFISEQLLKKKVEQLFGKDSYVRTTQFSSDVPLSQFVYDESQAGYILGTIASGCGSGHPTYSTNLVSAKKNSNELIVQMNYVSKYDEQSKSYFSEEELKEREYDILVEYTFKLENVYYYFETAKIVEQ